MKLEEIVEWNVNVANLACTFAALLDSMELEGIVEHNVVASLTNQFFFVANLIVVHFTSGGHLLLTTYFFLCSFNIYFVFHLKYCHHHQLILSSSLLLALVHRAPKQD